MPVSQTKSFLIEKPILDVGPLAVGHVTTRLAFSRAPPRCCVVLEAVLLTSKDDLSVANACPLTERHVLFECPRMRAVGIVPEYGWGVFLFERMGSFEWAGCKGRVLAYIMCTNANFKAVKDMKPLKRLLDTVCLLDARSVQSVDTKIEGFAQPEVQPNQHVRLELALELLSDIGDARKIGVDGWITSMRRCAKETRKLRSLASARPSSTLAHMIHVHDSEKDAVRSPKRQRQ